MQVSPELHLLCDNEPFHGLQTIPSRLNIPKSCSEEAARLVIKPAATAHPQPLMREWEQNTNITREKSSFLWDEGDFNQTFACTAAIYHIDLQSQSASSKTDRRCRGCCGLLEERGGNAAFPSRLLHGKPTLSVQTSCRRRHVKSPSPGASKCYVCNCFCGKSPRFKF